MDSRLESSRRPRISGSQYERARREGRESQLELTFAPCRVVASRTELDKRARASVQTSSERGRRRAELPLRQPAKPSWIGEGRANPVANRPVVVAVDGSERASERRCVGKAAETAPFQLAQASSRWLGLRVASAILCAPTHVRCARARCRSLLPLPSCSGAPHWLCCSRCSIQGDRAEQRRQLRTEPNQNEPNRTELTATTTKASSSPPSPPTTKTGSTKQAN